MTPSRKSYVVRRLLPPVLLELMGRRLSSRTPHYRRLGFVWEGIYKDRQSVPTKNDRYDNEVRIAEFVESARQARALMKAGQPVNVPCFWHEALGLLAASITSDGCIRVLDFGGAVGLAFLELLSVIRRKDNLMYYVIELENMCAAGRQLFADESRIQFCSTWPPVVGQIDILYASTVLPYIDDYQGLLRQFAAVKARYILLNQLAAGAFPAYAAKQLNLPGQVLAYWFLNLQEVIEILAAGGYTCAYETQAGPEYDQSNYPGVYRLGRMRTMLFVRN